MTTIVIMPRGLTILRHIEGKPGRCRIINSVMEDAGVAGRQTRLHGLRHSCTVGALRPAVA